MKNPIATAYIPNSVMMDVVSRFNFDNAVMNALRRSQYRRGRVRDIQFWVNSYTNEEANTARITASCRRLCEQGILERKEVRTGRKMMIPKKGEHEQWVKGDDGEYRSTFTADQLREVDEVIAVYSLA